MRICNEIHEYDWNLNAAAIDWANSSIPYFYLEAYSETLMKNVYSRTFFAIFYVLTMVAGVILTSIPETLMVTAGICWMELVCEFKKKIESKEIHVTWDEVRNNFKIK